MRPLLPIALAGLLLAPIAHADVPPAQPGTPVAVAKPAAAAAKAPARKARKAKKGRKKREIKGPVASFPGFRLLPGGESRVYVEISEKVDITEHKAEGRVAYRMKGVSVPTKTNRLPLETMFFRTPVSRVQLTEQGDDDVDLVIELSQPSSPTYKIVDSEGGVVLQVDFPSVPALPAGAKAAPPPTPKPPKKASKPRAAEGMEN